MFSLTKKEMYWIIAIVNVVTIGFVVGLSLIEKAPLIARLWPLILVMLLISGVVGFIVSASFAGATQKGSQCNAAPSETGATRGSYSSSPSSSSSSSAPSGGGSASKSTQSGATKSA